MSEHKPKIEMSHELADSSKEPTFDNEKEKEYKWVTPAEVRTKLDNISRDKYIELYNIMESSFNEKKLTKEQFDQTIEKIDELSKKELGYKITEWKKSNELSKEELEFSQSLYDFLNLDYNLEEHINEKGIDLISREQNELLEKEGYNYSLIIPGDIPRNELIERILKLVSKEFNSAGIKFNDRKHEDTQIAKDKEHKYRPNKPYQIKLKLPIDEHGNLCSGLYNIQEEDNNGRIIPEFNTIGKTFPQCMDILKKLNNNDSMLNLKGLSLSEYLISDMSIYFKAKQDGRDSLELSNSHLEINGGTWLLDELIKDDKGNPMRSFYALWMSHGIDGFYGVIDKDINDTSSNRGARFVALPKKYK